MPATIYFAGAEDIDYTLVGSVTVETAPSYRDSTYSRCALQVTSAGTLRCPITDNDDAPIAVPELWVGARVVSVAGGAVATAILFQSGAADIARVRVSGPSAWTLQLYDGSAWVDVAAGSGNVSTLAKLDVYLKLDDTEGVFRLYVNGVTVAEYVGDTIRGSESVVDLVSLSGYSVSQVMLYSEVVIADSDTRSMRVKTLTPNAAGAHTDGSGAYTDIDEIAVSSVDALTFDAAGQRHSVGLTNLPAGLTGMQVACVIAVASVARGDSGPQTGHLGVRSGGTTDTEAVAALAQSYEMRKRKLRVNPVTGVRFTIPEVDALELVMGAEA